MSFAPAPPNSTIIENKEGSTLSWEPGISQALLQKGLKVKVNTESRTIDCRVSDWYYEVTLQTSPKLHIIVDILREPYFEKLDPDLQEGLRFLITLLVLFVFGTIFYLGYIGINRPQLFWGVIGYYIRWTVLLAILLVGLLVIGRTKGFLKRKTFSGQSLATVYTFLTFIMMGAWWYISVPPNELKVYPEDYSQYIWYIGQQFKQSIILPLISVSWLAGVFNLLGWSAAASTVDLVAKIFKRKE